MTQLFLQQAVLASLGEEDMAKMDALLNKIRAARDLDGGYLFKQSHSSNRDFVNCVEGKKNKTSTMTTWLYRTPSPPNRPDLDGEGNKG